MTRTEIDLAAFFFSKKVISNDLFNNTPFYHEGTPAQSVRCPRPFICHISSLSAVAVFAGARILKVRAHFEFARLLLRAGRFERIKHLFAARRSAVHVHHALYLPIYPSSTFYKYEPAVEIALFSTSICNQGSPTNRTFPPPLLTNTSTSPSMFHPAVLSRPASPHRNQRHCPSARRRRRHVSTTTTNK